MTDSVPPACAKPPLRYMQAGDSASRQQKNNRKILMTGKLEIKEKKIIFRFSPEKT